MIVQQVDLVYSDRMNKLLNGDFAQTALGLIAKEILEASLGPGGTFNRHLVQRQGRWPRLADSTRADKRKRIPRIFEMSGNVRRKITTAAAQGKLLQWGGYVEAASGGNKVLRYNANGVWAQGTVRAGKLEIAIGFSGKLKHSRSFNRDREEVALQNGANLRGLSGSGRTKAIRAAASVTATQRYRRSKGRGVKGRKYAAAGALGHAGRRMVMARGNNNLAYANIVQAGPFKGVKSKGRTFKPQEVFIASRKGQIGKKYTIVRGSQPRPLLPFDSGDKKMIQEAADRGVRAAYELIGWGGSI